MTMLRPELDSLLAPISRAEFFERYRERRPFHRPGVAGELEALRESFGGFGEAELLALAKGNVVPIAQGGKQTLAFNLDPQHPRVAPWYEAFTAPLAPRPNRSVITAFLTPAGAGTPMHFDRYDVFNVQLSGTKRWRIGRAPSVAAPLHEWQVGQVLPRELRAYWDVEPGAEVDPSTLETITMTPGSVLYLPRGCVHETFAADETSIGISFVVDVCSTFEVLSNALRVLMLREPALRSGSDTGVDLDEALAQVSRLVKSLRPADLVAPPESAKIVTTTRLRRSALALRTIELIEGSPTLVVRRIDHLDAAHINPSDAEILDWIDAQPHTFSANEIPSDLHTKYGAQRISHLFAVLVETGYLNEAA